MTVKTFLRLLAGIFITSALLVLVWQYTVFASQPSGYPQGMTMAGVPVEGLDQQAAAERLMAVYNAPVAVSYNDATFHLIPSDLGFVLDMVNMFELANTAGRTHAGLGGFLRSLWSRPADGPVSIPLLTLQDAEKMRVYLQHEVQPRYDQPAEPALPVPGGYDFTPGKPGRMLDTGAAMPLLIEAMSKPAERVATLPVIEVGATPPDPAVLEVMLSQLITVARFDGVAEIFVEDFSTGAIVGLAMDDGQPIETDVAFTAASLIKIPVMVSLFKTIDLPLDNAVETDLRLMINQSDNGSTDDIMRKYLGGNLAPVTVTQDIRSMGLRNTFLAGYFYLGAPLLDRIVTPANQRQDVQVGLDIYNQTTASDMATILKLLYQCEQQDTGLEAVFEGQISHAECEKMLEVLRNNRFPQLITAGLPEGTWIGQKHGWVIEEDGIMRTIVNSGLVRSPGGDYVISVFLYHPRQLAYDPANELMARLSRAVYNYEQLSIDSE